MAITCESFDLVNERIKVDIDDVRDFEFVLVVLKGEFVFVHLRHLYSDGSTVGLVLFEQFWSCISV